MSATTVMNSPVAAVAAVVAKKTRAATLPAKFNKFIQFGYYLTNIMKSANAIPIDVNEHNYTIDHIHMFDAIDVQQSFVQKFFDESKGIGQTMRKLVQQHNKQVAKALKLAAMPPKEKKVRATTNAKKNIKQINTDVNTENNTAADVKPVKAKKNSKKIVIQDELVAELVTLATGNTLIQPVTDTETETFPENVTIEKVEEGVTGTDTVTVTVTETVKAKKVSKPRAKKDVAPVVTTIAPVVPLEPVETTKPNAKKESKAKAKKDVVVAPVETTNGTKKSKAKPTTPSNATNATNATNVDNVIKLDENYEDIFISEKDTFNVSIEYYKDEENILVEDVDDKFDKTRKAKKISMTFKYPSQGDVTAISNNPIRSHIKSVENMSLNEFMLLEIARFMCLIRAWSLPQKINNDTIFSINPKIIKGILNKVRNKIGTEGII